MSKNTTLLSLPIKLNHSIADQIIDRYKQIKSGVKIDFREAYSEILDLKIVADPFTATPDDRIFGLLREEHIGAILSWEIAVEAVLKNFPGAVIVDGGLGTGILGIWAARKFQEIYGSDFSNKLVGFDINKKAICYAKANSLINNVNHMMEFRYQPYQENSLPQESASMVLLNPPYQLVAPGFEAPIHADGGFDGLKVVRTSTRSAAHHICKQGIICMTTKAIGTKEYSLVEKEFLDGSLVGDAHQFTMDVFNILSPIQTKNWINYIYQNQCPDYANQVSEIGDYLHFIATIIYKDGGGGVIRKLESSLDLEGFGWEHHLDAHRLMTNVTK